MAQQCRLSVTVIIPALNEEESIGQVLAALRQAQDTAIPTGVTDEIIVVDGGSSDGTAAIARAGGARVIHEPRRGYGRACAAGVAAAQGNVVLFLDADGADDPGQIPDLLAPILAGRADMVLGSRLAGEIAPGAMPWHQRFGNRLAAWLIRSLYGLPLTDLSPFRAVSRELLLELGMGEMTYGWPTEMIVKAARQGWRVVEIPRPLPPPAGRCGRRPGAKRGRRLLLDRAEATPTGAVQRDRLWRNSAEWSSERVTAQTLSQAEALGLNVALLPPWYDVDTAADLDRLRTELMALPAEALPHSRRFFASDRSSTRGGQNRRPVAQ